LIIGSIIISVSLLLSALIIRDGILRRANKSSVGIANGSSSMNNSKGILVRDSWAAPDSQMPVVVPDRVEHNIRPAEESTSNSLDGADMLRHLREGK